MCSLETRIFSLFSAAMLSRLLIIFSCSFVQGLADTIYQCPTEVSDGDSYTRIFKDKCYQFNIHQRKEFSDAQNYCKGYGGNLVMINSDEVNDFIGDTIETFHVLEPTSAWIGLVYTRSDKSYAWVDGSKMGEYDNFMKRRWVDDGDCVGMVTRTKLWCHYSCDSPYFGMLEWAGKTSKKIFICEFPAIAVSTATTPTNKREITVENCPETIARTGRLQVFGSKCYEFKMNPYKSFNDAQEDCQRRGGILVKADSQDVNTFLQEEWYHSYDLRNYGAWIGLKYDLKEGSYLWVDGSQLSNSYFRPSRFRESDKCVIISVNYGTWGKRNCEKVLRPYVCEFEPIFHPHRVSTLPPMSTNPSALTTKQTTFIVAPSKTSTHQKLSTTTTTSTLNTRMESSTTSTTTTTTTTTPSSTTATTTPKTTTTTTAMTPTTTPSTTTTTPKTTTTTTTPKTTTTTIPKTTTTTTATTPTTTPSTTTTTPKTTTTTSTSTTPTTSFKTTTTTTTPLPPTTTTTTTTTATTPTPTSTPPPPPPTTTTTTITKCPVIVCDLECGLNGYSEDSNKCMQCQCAN